MTEQETRSRVYSRLEDVRQELAILWSTLTAIHAALQCNRRNWELYQEALYGLLNKSVFCRKSWSLYKTG